MADYIGDICREYVDEVADTLADMTEDEAVEALVRGANRRLGERGWTDDAERYGVNVGNVVRLQLRMHRAQN